MNFVNFRSLSRREWDALPLDVFLDTIKTELGLRSSDLVYAWETEGEKNGFNSTRAKALAAEARRRGIEHWLNL